jgi:heme oxygenase (biliverdin-IX-beta and delta-forming)
MSHLACGLVQTSLASPRSKNCGRISMNHADVDDDRLLAGSAPISARNERRSTIDLLRAGTAKHHLDLESGLQIQDRLSEPATRGPLIAGYLAFYRETERALRPYLADMPDLAFSSRFHSRQISATAALSARELVSIDPSFPTIGTKAEALGAFYVLEGSTLGGKIILNALRNRGVSTDNLHFLNPYGSESGARWRSFLNILERETGHDRSTINACIAGAIKGFAFATACLRAERTN